MLGKAVTLLGVILLAVAAGLAVGGAVAWFAQLLAGLSLMGLAAWLALAVRRTEAPTRT